jgi:hypothetical protein
MKTKLFSILLAISLANISLLNASNYDDDILNIFSKIVPRFIMMSSQKEKIKENIQICILDDDIDKLTALSLIDKINNNYPSGLKNHDINLLNVEYKNIEKCKNSELIFMFNSDKEDINSAVMFSNKYHILTMSYDNELLQNGVNISLFIGRRVLPYINMEAIKKNNIELDNILLRVSKIYSGGQK